MKSLARAMLILVAITFALNAPCPAQTTKQAASKPAEETATGILSRQFNVFFGYLIITLEGQEGGFFVRLADFQRWGGNSLFGQNVTITYKETKLEPGDEYAVSLVTGITSARSQASKQLQIAYVEKLAENSPVANEDLFLAYQDPNNGKWTVKKERTDANGRVVFSVPAKNSGESFDFVFSLSESEINTFIEEAKNQKRPVFVISDKQDEVQLHMDRNYDAKTVKGSLTARKNVWVPLK